MCSRLLPLLLYFTLTTACPSNQTLRQLCKCESTFNGILLDCSSPSSSDPIDSPLILRVLQENRAQLGLIQELQLRNGTLASLNSRQFDGLYIKKLDLSENRLENISIDAFRGLENVLQILNLSKNQLRKFPAKPLENMLVLLQLDLSENRLSDLEEDDALRGTPKLYDLNLANNRICSAHKQVFDDLKSSIQTLNLGGNCFTKVPAAAVRGFKQLLALHLHHNEIEQLEPLQFMNLPSLNLINLARNRIQILHRQSFLNVPNLRFFYLSDNNISKLDPQDFRTFENLELLDLTRNQIQKIARESFVGMPRLSQLYLGENGIREIEQEAFSNSSLVILLLPNNELEELRAEMFDGLQSLQQFSLKGNKITKIASNTFYQMPSLVVVDLSDNEITTLEPATFLAQLNLFLLDLSRNKIPITPNNAFNRRIVTVVLQENPLVCSERVHILQNGVGVNVPGSEDAVCGGLTPAPTAAPSATGAPNVNGLDTAPPVNSEVPSFVQESTEGAIIIQHHTPRGPSNRSIATTTPFNRFPLGPQATVGPIGPDVAPGFVVDSPQPVVPSVVPVGTGASWVPPVGNSTIGVNPAPGSGNPGGFLPFPAVQSPVAVNTETGPVFGTSTGGSAPSFSINQGGQPTDVSNSRSDSVVPQGRGQQPPVPGPISSFTVGTGPHPGGPVDLPSQPSTNGNPPPDVSRPPPVGSNGKSDPQQPFGLTPLLTVVPSSNRTNLAAGSGSGSSSTGASGDNPGIVEQIPLENEGQGGIIGANRPPPRRPSIGEGQQEPPPLGAGPEFSWTWAPNSGTHPAPTNPEWPQPEGVTPGSTGVFPGAAGSGGTRPSFTPGQAPISPWQPSDRPSPQTPSPTPLEPKTAPPPKKHRPEDELGRGSDAAAAAAGEFDPGTAASAGSSATTTIAVCLTVVVVVLISVFITLCVVRHRSRRVAASGGSGSNGSVSSESRTSAYVAAQAARMNYAQSTYGHHAGAYMTAGRPGIHQHPAVGTLQRPTPTNSQAWIYAPGTYASPSTYYK